MLGATFIGLVVLGLVAAVVARRRAARRQTGARPAEVTAARVAAVAPTGGAALVERPRVRPSLPRRGARAAGGAGLELAAAGGLSASRVCPTCRTEYDGLTYCTRDARRLVPPEEMLAKAHAAGVVCAACRRAYEPGLRRCPHDGTELLAFPVYSATRPRRGRATEPAGVIARICPVCASRYDLSARFCGHDGGELVVIN